MEPRENKDDGTASPNDFLRPAILLKSITRARRDVQNGLKRLLRRRFNVYIGCNGGGGNGGKTSRRSRARYGHACRWTMVFLFNRTWRLRLWKIDEKERMKERCGHPTLYPFTYPPPTFQWRRPVLCKKFPHTHPSLSTTSALFLIVEMLQFVFIFDFLLCFEIQSKSNQE